MLFLWMECYVYLDGMLSIAWRHALKWDRPYGTLWHSKSYNARNKKKNPHDTKREEKIYIDIQLKKWRISNAKNRDHGYPVQYFAKINVRVILWPIYVTKQHFEYILTTGTEKFNHNCRF